ncbi:MAG: tyrosine-type recombinase/integrase [Saccharospirillaceae bacterium]|nr:tyrosine-type recombinase/integrase [Pseudomonadales bacterium]NRB81133.1 tyrosine-type recombinase/integrase [Saccharospirillaceae bacterium]
MQTITHPFPLFDSYKRFIDADDGDYPETHILLNPIFSDDQNKKQHYIWTKEYLLFIARNKAEGTFDRFRNECERFLLWCWCFKSDKSLAQLNKIDILEYADFLWSPPKSWIGHDANTRRYIEAEGLFKINGDWRPFVARKTKSLKVAAPYQISQSTLNASFVALTTFFNHLIDLDFLGKNPIKQAKKDCRHLMKNTQIKQVHRLNDLQWQTVLDCAKSMADQDSKYERHLFLVAALKSLYLRISELSERENWKPVMSHFWHADGYWWLKIYGKGNKVRDVSVPQDFLLFLERYRISRNLSPLPMMDEKTAIISKNNSHEGLGSRQLRRFVQSVFDEAFHLLVKKGLVLEASELKSATTHWLRHTGASMDVENNRDLKYLSEDLGHASLATTDTIYVQTDIRNRAESGKYRKV